MVETSANSLLCYRTLKDRVKYDIVIAKPPERPDFGLTMFLLIHAAESLPGTTQGNHWTGHQTDLPIEMFFLFQRDLATYFHYVLFVNSNFLYFYSQSTADNV